MIPYLETLSRHWLPVCKTRDIGKKPVALRILGESIVAFRGENGSIGVLRDRCPHRNVPLSAGKVSGSCIQCPYHGWTFDAQGLCRSIPGMPEDVKTPEYRATAYETKERAGLVWIKIKPASENETAWELPPHMENASYDTRIWTVTARCSMMNALENFLDGTHTHFVHAGIVRSDTERKKVMAEISPGKDTVTITYRNEDSQNGIISRLFEPKRESSRATFSLPCTATLEYNDDKGPYFSVSAFMVPEDAERLKIFACISHRTGIIPGKLKHLLIHPFFRTVLQQDIKILEAQQASIKRFGGESFIITTQDLIRPYLHKLLVGAEITDGARETCLFL